MNDPSELVARSFRVPGYLYKALLLLAHREHRSMNQQLRVILEESLDAPKGDSDV